MRLENIRRLVSLLSFFVLAVLVWYISSSRSLLPGALYLVAATYPGLISLDLASRLLRKQRRDNPEPGDWASHTKAYVFLLCAWQVAIIGFLNMWPFGSSETQVTIIIGYLLAAVFMVLSYKLVAVADNEKQMGGSSPLNFFGRPRSRRLVYGALIYSPTGPLVALSVVWTNWRWCPTILRVPNIWLLLAALLSAISAGLVFQRYRSLKSESKRLGSVVVIGTSLVLAFAAVIEIGLRYSTYMYVLSSIGLVSIAVAMYSLSLAREAPLI